MTLAVDSSALLAILFREADGPAFMEALLAAEKPRLSYVILHESRIVLLRRIGPQGVNELGELIIAAGIECAAFDEAQAQLAYEAFAHFGKGRHRARLNLADCASYALAKSMNAPLLFKGDDFRLTDVTPAL